MANILVVDDRAINRQFLITLLNYIGHDLTEAADGVEALELVRKQTFDLAIVDIDMPRMDGIEFVRQMRQETTPKEMPEVVFYTAIYRLSQARLLAEQVNIKNVMTKPSTPQEILKMVETLLKDRGSVTPLASVSTCGCEERILNLETVNNRLAAVIELYLDLAMQRDPKLLVQHLCEAGRGILDAEVALATLNQEGSLDYFASDPTIAIEKHQLQSEFFSSLSHRHNFLQVPSQGKTCDVTIPGISQVSSVLAVPVTVKEEPLGWLCFVNKISKQRFSMQDAQIASTLAAMLGVSYKNSQLDKELAATNKELKQTDEKLRQSQKMEAIGRLAGGVAHDFNNLLTVILGHCGIIEYQLSPESIAANAISEIKEAGERAANLTQQLLAYSRKQILKPEPLNLTELVESFQQLLLRLIGEDIEVICDLDRGLGNILADKGELEQVILNLAINARDAMPTGGKLTFKTEHQLVIGEPSKVPAGNYVVLSVVDTGTGMSPEIQEQIFEPFFTTKAVGKGTGLGLSTVFGVVSQSQAHINVESEIGQGTTFRLFFPLLQVTEVLPKKMETKDSRGSESILIVEDEESIRKITCMMLEAYGYSVLPASDFESALQLLDSVQDKVDLLVSDVVIPNESGFEIAEKLKERLPNLPVLFMSGYTDDAILRHGVSQKTTHFISKPFTPSQLSTKVREVLDHGK